MEGRLVLSVLDWLGPRCRTLNCLFWTIQSEFDCTVFWQLTPYSKLEDSGLCAPWLPSAMPGACRTWAAPPDAVNQSLNPKTRTLDTIRFRDIVVLQNEMIIGKLKANLKLPVCTIQPFSFFAPSCLAKIVSRCTAHSATQELVRQRRSPIPSCTNRVPNEINLRIASIRAQES